MPLDSILYTSEIDHKVQILNDIPIALFDRHATLKTVKCNKPNAPRLTNNKKALIKFSEAALTKFKETRNPLHRITKSHNHHS